MTRILVETNDFRAGLISTVAHASNGKYDPELARVRLDVGPVNMHITATDRFTVGLALVSVEAHIEPELEIIDIGIEDVEKILTVFKGGRTKGDDPEHILRIEATDEHVKITDSSGMIDGRALELPRLASDEAFPDLTTTFAHAQHSPLRSVDMLAFGMGQLKKFNAAAACYREPLVFESIGTSSSITVRCGSSFIGRIPQVPLNQKLTDQLSVWRDGWDERIPRPTGIDLKTATGLFSVSDLEDKEKP